MFRVFLVCSDLMFCDELRDCFERECEFQVCGETHDGVDAVKIIVQLEPDLVVLEEESPPTTVLDLASSIKAAMPEVTVFLVVNSSDVSTEKEALASHVEAVFEKADFSALLLNARALCGLD